MNNPPLYCRDNPWVTRTAQISAIEKETDDVATYRLSIDDALGACCYDFVPGQFNMLYLPGVGESAISMSGDPAARGVWTHTVRVAGHVTHMLSKLNVSDTIGVRGPFGVGWPVDELVGSDVLIVAGGLGIAPLRPLVYHIINQRDHFGHVWLIYGSRAPDTLLYRGEYDRWRRNGIDVELTVDRATFAWSGHVGVVTSLVEQLSLPRVEATRLVMCGPEVMMKYAASSGLQRGLPAEHIWLSAERNMQCAVGHCGHCQFGPHFICKDGPVIRYDRLSPYLFVEHL